MAEVAALYGFIGLTAMLFTLVFIGWFDNDKTP